KAIEGVYLVEKNENIYSIYVDSIEKRLWDVLKEISYFGKIKNMVVKEVDLEDVFNKLAK
ncbi:MAG: hypothetical protein QXF29_00180, partial [Archaeoglobaceae archaeon]